jgi:hypothetical protein
MMSRMFREAEAQGKCHSERSSLPRAKPRGRISMCLNGEMLRSAQNDTTRPSEPE